jgi:hypothetical protein
MIGFINTLLTHTLLITLIYKFNTAYTVLTLIYTLSLGFSVSNSRLLATDLHTETSTQIATSITHKIFQSHFTFLTGRPLVFFCTPGFISLSINLHNSHSILVLVLSTAEPSWTLHFITVA